MTSAEHHARLKQLFLAACERGTEQRASFLEESLRDASALIGEIPVDSFDAPNDNARRGRRNALSNKLTAAANAVRAGDIQGAIDLLESVLLRLDGDASPPDWMVDPQRTILRGQITLLIALLELLL